MINFQAQIEKAKAQLENAIEDLKIWESFDAVTVTNESTGKVTNLRAQMIARIKQNMQLYKQIIAALEKRAENSNWDTTKNPV